MPSPPLKPPQPEFRHGHPLTKGLVGVWAMHEKTGDTFYDLSPRKRHMTISSHTASLRVVGDPGWIYAFDGSASASVTHPEATAVNSVTVATWARYTSAQATAIVPFAANWTTTNRWWLGIEWTTAASKLRFQARDSATTVLDTSAEYNDGEWHFLVGRSPQGGQLSFYVDWDVEQLVDGGAAMGALNSGTSPLEIAGFGGGFQIEADIASLMVWDRAITDAEVQELYMDTWGIITPAVSRVFFVPPAAAPLDVATITPVPEARDVPPAQRFDLDLAYDGFPAYLEAAAGVALVKVVDETEAVSETTVDARTMARVVDETEAITETTVDARTMVRVVTETEAIPEADNLAATWLDILNETEAVSETTVISGIPLGEVGPGIRNDTEGVTETVVTVMEAFQDMTFDLSVGGDLMSGMRKVHEDAEYVIYQAQLITSGDAAIQGGFTANKLNAERQIVAMVNYGHKGTETPNPLRQTITATLTWDSGAGTITGIVLDNDQGGAYTVLSGSAIPPLILDWNASSKTQTSRFEGDQYAFVTDFAMWLKNPGSSGVTSRFAFRFDPSREDTSYARMMRAPMYGGSWVNDDTWGTRVRPDLLQFHTDENQAWYKFGRRDPLPPNGSGNGWWINTTQLPTVTSDWDLYARSQHADAGFGPFCMAFINGGKAFWSNTAYHMIVMQIAARWLNQFPTPGIGYAGKFFTNYHDDSMRGVGRILALGIHAWRALVKMTAYRTQNDTEANTLAAAVGVRWLEIFNHVYHYSKPEALGSEPAPIYGYWQRSVSGPRHPDAGGTVSNSAQLACYQIYQGGLLWQGLYLGYEAMQEFGLTGLREYARLFQWMRFIALGHASVPGVYTLTFKWQNSHPYEPPSPNPPAWALRGACPIDGKNWPSIGCWPGAMTFFVTGFGWCSEYLRPHGETLAGKAGNDNNTDLRFLSAPSTSTFGYGCTAMMQWLKRDGILSATKLDEIVIDYTRRQPYQWKLGEALVKVVNDTVAIGPEVAGDVTAFKVTSNPTETVHVVDNTVAIPETAVAVITGTDLLVKVVSETVAIGTEDPDVDSILYARTRVLFVNTQVELGETLLSAGLAKAIVKVVDENLGVADPDEGVDEVIFRKKGTGNDNTALTGTGTSVNATLTGAGASVNSAKTGTGSSVNTALTGG